MIYKNRITCIRASNIRWMNIGFHVISVIVQTHELYNMIKDNSGTSSRTTIKRRQCLSIRPCKTLLYKWKHVIIHNFTIAFLQLLNIFNARTHEHTHTHISLFFPVSDYTWIFNGSQFNIRPSSHGPRSSNYLVQGTVWCHFTLDTEVS